MALIFGLGFLLELARWGQWEIYFQKSSQTLWEMTYWKHFSRRTLSYKGVFVWCLNSISFNWWPLQDALRLWCLPRVAVWVLDIEFTGAQPWLSPAPEEVQVRTATQSAIPIIFSVFWRERGMLGRMLWNGFYAGKKTSLNHRTNSVERGWKTQVTSCWLKCKTRCAALSLLSARDRGLS